jgi:hypothetical protein
VLDRIECGRQKRLAEALGVEREPCSDAEDQARMRRIEEMRKRRCEFRARVEVGAILAELVGDVKRGLWTGLKQIKEDGADVGEDMDFKVGLETGGKGSNLLDEGGVGRCEDLDENRRRLGSQLSCRLSGQ